MDAAATLSSGLKIGDGMGDFMRFTTDAPFPDDGDAAGAGAIVRSPAEDLPVRRPMHIGTPRRGPSRGRLRLL